MSYVDCTRPTARSKPKVPFFSAVPHHVQDDPRLKARDIQTLASILRFARSKDWASMGNRTLAGMGRCSERTIQSSLSRLEKAGHIRREDDASGRFASGRLIYLIWRGGEIPDTPRVKSASSPGVKSLAPELDPQGIRKGEAGPVGLGSPGPVRGETEAKPPGPQAPPEPASVAMPEAEKAEALAKLAEYPPGHPMRGLWRSLAGLPPEDAAVDRSKWGPMVSRPTASGPSPGPSGTSSRPRSLPGEMPPPDLRRLGSIGRMPWKS